MGRYAGTVSILIFVGILHRLVLSAQPKVLCFISEKEVVSNGVHVTCKTAEGGLPRTSYSRGDRPKEEVVQKVFGRVVQALFYSTFTAGEEPVNPMDKW